MNLLIKDRPKLPCPPRAGTPWVLLLGLTLLGGAGCRQEQIRVYQAPKPVQATAHAGPHNHEEHLHWEAPEGWVEQAAEGVRTATFLISGEEGAQAEVAIMPFKKMGAADLEFVNLWRTSMRLEPVDESSLSGMVQPVTIGGQAGKLFNVVDPSNQDEVAASNRIIVAQLVRGQTSWFFKLAGDTAMVEQQLEPFKTFLQTVTFHEADAHTSDAHASDATLAQSPPPSAPPLSEPGIPEWSAPSHWQEQPPSTMVLAKYLVTGQEGASAQLSVSVFPGDVGGLLANVNRWRAQVGVGPVSADQLQESLEPLDLGGQSPGAVLVDVTGQDPEGNSASAMRLIGAIIPRGGQTWFYKLLGADSVVGPEKDNLIKFIQSARYPNA